MFRFITELCQLVSFDSLKSFWKVASTGGPRRQRNVSSMGVFAFQILEPRNLLAGDVTAVFSDGTLNVTGDTAGNLIRITNDGGGLSVAGIDTTINGGTAAFNTNLPVVNLTIQMGDGADTVTLDGATVLRWITIEGGSGQDAITAENVGARYLHVEGGDGDDVIQALDSTFIRHLYLDGNEGDNTIAVNAVTTGRDADLWARSGADTFAIGDLNVGRRLSIHPGLGNDQVLISGQTEVRRRTRVSLSGGNDFFGSLPSTQSLNTIFSRRLRLNTGDGNDTVAFDAGTTINHNKLDGDGGSDRLSIADTNFRNSRHIKDFETFDVDNLNAIVDGIFNRLNNAGIDAGLFGGDSVVEEELDLNIASTPLEFEEGGGTVLLDEDLAIAGPSDLVVNSAQVDIGGFVPGEDELTFNAVDGITGDFDSATGILSFTGDAPPEDYALALSSVRYGNNGNDLSGSRTLTTTLDTNAGSTSASRTLNFAVIEDVAPSITLTETAIDIDVSDTPAVIDSTIVVADADSVNLSDATVAISSGALDGDVLSFTPVAGISGSFNSATQTLSFTGDASVEDYQELFQSVTFGVADADRSLTDRVITFEVSDGITQTSESVTVSVVDANQVTLGLDSTDLAYTENDGPVEIDANVTLAPNTANIDSASVRFLSGHVPAEDALNVTDGSGVTGSFDASTGVLDLTGTASADVYQTILRSLTYENVSDDPTEGIREIELTVTSAGLVDESATRNIVITGVNDPLNLSVPATFATNPVVLPVDTPINFSAVASDNDDENFTYILDLDESNISLSAAQPTIDSDTGEFNWTPSETGEFLVRIIAINESGQANQTDILFNIESL